MKIPICNRSVGNGSKPYAPRSASCRPCGSTKAVESSWRNRETSASLCSGALLVCAAIALADGPRRAVRPLALDVGNPHYLVFRGKPVVLVGSGEHYGSVLNLDFDYIRYLDALAADGLDHTRLFSGTYHEPAGAFGIVENTLAPQPRRYICPWKRSTTPGANDGGNKFDLTRFDPAYFERLDDFLTQAGNRKIVVEVNLFSPNYDDSIWAINPMNARNNINDVGAVPANETYTLKHPELLKVQDAVVRKIVSHCQAFDNLVFRSLQRALFRRRNCRVARSSRRRDPRRRK